jgi:hypothetical protein
VLIKDSYNVLMHNVGVFNHGICFEASAEMVYGIHLAADMLTTGGCSDAHFVINSWPEVFVTNSRFGINGFGDYAANAYVRITGTCDPVNAAGLGANTVYFTNNQFNQGQNLVGAFLEWKNISPSTCPSDEIISEYVFTGNHIEGPNFGIRTDASATQIRRIKFTGNYFLPGPGSGSEFWSFGAATRIVDFSFIGNTTLYSTFTFAPGAQIISAQISNNNFKNGGARYTGTGAGNAMIASANLYNGTVSITGRWATASFSGIVLTGTAPTNSTGNPRITFPGP